MQYQLCLKILIILLLGTKAVERFVFLVTPEATKAQRDLSFLLSHTHAFSRFDFTNHFPSLAGHCQSNSLREERVLSMMLISEKKTGDAYYTEIKMLLKVASEQKIIYFIAFKIFLCWEFQFLINAQVTLSYSNKCKNQVSCISYPFCPAYLHQT